MRKKQPNILALDTSSPVLRVALKKGRKDVREARLKGFFKHAEGLLPAMDRLLKKSGLRVRDIDVFLIGQGPGSFTGLRIGFATLKGFLTIERKACYGASSLDLLSENIQPRPGAFLAAAIDAHRGKVYTRFFQEKAGRWQPRDRAKTLNIDEFAAALPPDSRITGNACGRYRDILLRHHKKLRLAPEKFWYPKASALIHLYGRTSKTAGETGNLLKPLREPADFIPRYHRLSEAEERQKKNAAHH